MKTAGSPHWHPAIQAFLLPERRGIVALVRRPIWKMFPERPAPPARPEGRQKPPPEPAGTQTFFEIFRDVAAAGSFPFPLIDWNRWNYFDDPLCDDLLTMGVDNPGRGGL